MFLWITLVVANLSNSFVIPGYIAVAEMCIRDRSISVLAACLELAVGQLLTEDIRVVDIAVSYTHLEHKRAKRVVADIGFCNIKRQQMAHTTNRNQYKKAHNDKTSFHALPPFLLYKALQSAQAAITLPKVCLLYTSIAVYEDETPRLVLNIRHSVRSFPNFPASSTSSNSASTWCWKRWRPMTFPLSSMPSSAVGDCRCV